LDLSLLLTISIEDNGDTLPVNGSENMNSSNLSLKNSGMIKNDIQRNLSLISESISPMPMITTDDKSV
jgi:hypothetical protein